MVSGKYCHINFIINLHQGFRKVDTDKWEFANEWFLRGQTQLLCNIVRRKHTSRAHSTSHLKHEDEDDDLIMEIAKLKQEQKSLEQELESMNRRLEATERRPQQMMTFLCKVVEDPEILPRVMLEKEKMRRLTYSNSDKKRKLMISTVSSNSLSGTAISGSSIKSEEDQEPNAMAESTPISSPDGNLDVDTYCQYSPSLEISSPEWLSHGRNIGVPMIRPENPNYANLSSSSLLSYGGETGGLMAVAPPITSVAGHNAAADGFDINYFEGFVVGENASPPPPYPFSLLGGGF